MKNRMCYVICCAAIQFFFMGLSSVRAQEKPVKAKESKKDTKEKRPKTKESAEYSIGANTGVKVFKGIGIYDLGIRLGKSIAQGQRLQVEYNYRTSGKNYQQNWGRYELDMKAQIGSNMLALSYDFFPFVAKESWAAGANDWWASKLKSLKFKAGVQYLDKPNYNFNSSLLDVITWGSITFTPEEVGYVQTNISTNKVQPFLGFGYDRFYTGGKVSLGVEGGVLYQGKPRVSMTANNMLKYTPEVAPILQNNLKAYQLIPFVQLQMQIRLNK